MLRNQAEGERVCLTVAHLDSLCWRVAASITRPITARDGVRQRLSRYRRGREAARHRRDGRPILSRPHRGLEASNKQEIKATSFIAMEIEEASAKVRSKGRRHDDEDYELPIYASASRCAPCSARPSRVRG